MQVQHALPSRRVQPFCDRPIPLIGCLRPYHSSPCFRPRPERRSLPRPASTAPLATPCTAPATTDSGSGDAAGPMRHVAGLSEIAGRYKALLLDQFGVLHDGRRPYPGAVEAVAAASAAGLRLLIISNSSRRAGGTLDKLSAMGFDPGCFAGVVTSGELTHRYLTRRPDPWWAALGSRCLHMNWSRRGPASLGDFGLQAVTDPRDADFFLAHGTEALSLPGGGVEERPLEELRSLLVGAAEEAARRGGAAPPLVVANPDVVTVDGDDLVAMPGSLAAAYSAAGGQVVLMGKPSPLIYCAAGEMLGLPTDQLLAVGDSLEHDIAGAAAAGIDSLFIAGGIHAREVIREPPQPPQQPPAATVTTTVTVMATVTEGGSAREEEEEEGGGAATAGQAGPLVDMAALRQLVSRHPGLVSGPKGMEGPGAPTYVAMRFLW